MSLMKKIFLKFTIKFSLCISVIFWTSSCALFGFEDEAQQTVSTREFQKAEALVLNREFEKSLPILESVLKKADADYEASLLLSARSYDQLAQPEKVILALQELLSRDVDTVTQVKARSLLLKNLAKVKTDISEHVQKKILFNLLQGSATVNIENSSQDYLIALESLKWSVDFNCDQYCVEEVLYLNEIQLEYLYIIEKDEISADRAAETIKSRYEFFFTSLTKDHLEISFRKKIAVALMDSLRKIKSLQLDTQNQGSVRAAKFIQSLVPTEKKTEGWLYR
jgi:hypothetical protein